MAVLMTGLQGLKLSAQSCAFGFSLLQDLGPKHTMKGYPLPLVLSGIISALETIESEAVSDFVAFNQSLRRGAVEQK